MKSYKLSYVLLTCFLGLIIVGCNMTEEPEQNNFQLDFSDLDFDLDFGDDFLLTKVRRDSISLTALSDTLYFAYTEDIEWESEPEDYYCVFDFQITPEETIFQPVGDLHYPEKEGGIDSGNWQNYKSCATRECFRETLISFDKTQKLPFLFKIRFEKEHVVFYTKIISAYDKIAQIMTNQFNYDLLPKNKSGSVNKSPLVLINGRPVIMDSLKNYSHTQIKEVQTFLPGSNESRLFGTNGYERGIINISL